MRLALFAQISRYYGRVAQDDEPPVFKRNQTDEVVINGPRRRAGFTDGKHISRQEQALEAELEGIQR